ncbi:MAG: amidohydrolase family protein, partial [Planctomycetota bacterium]
MGAVIALDELVRLAKGELSTDAYGPYTGPSLAALMEKKMPWRISVSETGEARAALDFFGKAGLPLILDHARYLGDAAEDIAQAGVPVIVDVPIITGNLPELGKGEDARWPDVDVAARLRKAGVEVAITTPNNLSPRSLRFAAAVAMRGGMSEADALAAITSVPAKILGVDDKVGSLASGRYADFIVMSGAPLDMTSNVVATWTGGEPTWKASDLIGRNEDGGSAAKLASSAASKSAAPVVLRVEELHVGDGEIHRDVEVLLQDGKIAAIAPRVSRPLGAVVMSGKAAMPGMIDAMGHLGLEGSTRVPGPDFKLSQLVEPGDITDRRVAAHGVTTVVLAPRGPSNAGAPMMAYVPAGENVDHMVLADPAGMRFPWRESDRSKSGLRLRGVLRKAKDYKSKWDDYEEKLAKWTPPAPEPEPAPVAPDEDEGEDEDDEEEDE